MSPTGPTSRVGWGFDAHRLDGSPPLVLAGVVVSESLGVSATSDGDVVAHAVADALLGACALGDMGEHFPSSDPEMAGADSMGLLGKTVAMAARAGWRTAHVDVTVAAETVRIAPHRDQMRRELADVLGLDPDSVSVKATTTDGMGFIGRGEGLAAIAVLSVTPLT
ncbi:MAG TPA: 2-C-methyl-D-erythritol 2,4-cyclodiphosphate synthase [Acidimicrobiia bacterium]|nr:2-C-methyl-D-erythritol 2,4-cyclodiphosphate synthase [Acidimicrobiia bacterium]